MHPDLTSFLFTLTFFLPYTYVFIYLPGYLLSRRLTQSRSFSLALSLTAGLSLYSLVVYTFRFFSLPFWLAELSLFLPVIYLLRFKKFRFPSLSTSPHQLKLLGIFSLFALIQSAVLIKSGLRVGENLSFVSLSFHDSMQHLAIIKRLYHQSQVNHFGFSGADLTNYHYLIDLVLASITRFPFVSLFHVYYRLYPLFISLIFQLTVYSFVNLLTRSWRVSLWGVAFALFAGNASFYLSPFRGPEFSWGSNTFMINPLIDLLQNPASIFVFAQFLCVLLLLRFKFSPKQLLLIGLIAGTMIGFKAWGGLLIAAGLCVAALSHFARGRFSILFAGLVALVISSFIFLPHFDSQTSSSPVWAPGWTLTKMIVDADRVNLINDFFKLEHYRSVGSYHYLFLLYSKLLLLYLIGNYFLRIPGLIYVLVKPFKSRFDPFTSTIFVTTVLSLALPLLFNQGRMAYDIEQFAPYSLLLSAIFTAVLLDRLLKKSKHSWLIWSLAIIYLILSVPSNFTSLKARIIGQTLHITQAEQEAYLAVNQLVPRQEPVLLPPSPRTIATNEFAALTGRDTFFSGRTLSIITGEDFQSRLDLLNKHFSRTGSIQFLKFLREHQLNYLFVYQNDLNSFAPPSNLQPIFSNSAASLYLLQD